MEMGKKKKEIPLSSPGKPLNSSKAKKRFETMKRLEKARGGDVKSKMSPTSDRPNPKMNNMMKEAQRNYIGSYISGDLGGVKVSNKSYKKYYGKKVMP